MCVFHLLCCLSALRVLRALFLGIVLLLLLLVFVSFHCEPFLVSVSRHLMYANMICRRVSTFATPYGRNVYKIASVYRVRGRTAGRTACQTGCLLPVYIFSPKHTIFDTRCDSTTPTFCVHVYSILFWHFVVFLFLCFKAHSTILMCPSSGATRDKISN